MKKYRLTKITVKTREIVLLSNGAEGESRNSVCPVCNSPLSAPLSAAENSAAEANFKEQPAELSPAKVSTDRE